MRGGFIGDRKFSGGLRLFKKRLQYAAEFSRVQSNDKKEDKFVLKKTLISFFVVLIFTGAAFAQKVYTPEKGSKERAAIFSALRAPVEKELKQKIQFAVNDFKVQGNWAFLSGEPQSTSGGRPDYKNTEYREAIEADMFDNNFFALLRKSGGRWKIVTYAIGCTDVCYLTWPKDFKAPKAVFPAVE